MTTLYHYSIGTNVHEDGVTAFPITGEAVTVDGQPMVRLAHGVIHHRDGWHETEAAALAYAADQVAVMASRLLIQANAIQAKALAAVAAAYAAEEAAK